MPYKDKHDPRLLEAKKKWYKNNKQKHLANGYKRRKEILEYVKKIKDNPCMDCGNKFHFSAMDFDHREGEEKINNVSVLVRYGWKRILEEIKKCDLVCSNCHRVRTFKRQNAPVE